MLRHKDYTVSCYFNLHFDLHKQTPYKKKPGRHCVGGGGLVDNDHDPSIAHPPTEDHPLADSLVLSLAIQELLITITTQSATNEPGGEKGARFVS